MGLIQTGLADPMVITMEDTGGSYCPLKRHISINLKYANDPLQLKEILWHELLHRLSGQTAIKGAYKQYEDVGSRVTRIGIH